jgi:hypothetical protein
MPLLTRKRILLAKSESTYATSSAPDGSNAVLVSNLEVEPLAMELAERELITGNLGQRDSVVTQRMARVTFSVELASSGAAGTAPRWGPVMKACGFSETISASTSVTYAPVSSSFSSATLDFYNDGVRQLIVGARGTWSLEMSAGEVGAINFEMMGIYAAPTALSNVTPTYANQVAPVAVNADNTTAVSVHSYSACMAAFSLELGNEMVYRQLAGCTKEIIIPDRKPTGSLTIELPPIGTKDYFSIASAQTKGSISWQHGQTAGNIITLTAATSAFDSPTYEDADGIQHLVLPFRPIPTSAGNDEFSLVLT